MTTPLADVGLIMAPSYRSRAYVQMLVAQGLKPALALAIPGREAMWDGAAHIDVPLGAGAPFRFLPGVPARETAAAAGWTIAELAQPNINAPESVAQIAALSVEVLIYSGLSKILLGRELLGSGKRFLHVHGGFVPMYRGATAFYFGLLERGLLGESAIWLDAGVDTGPLLMREWYRPAPGVEIDRVMDPIARADLLARVLRARVATGSYPATPMPEASENFFIIHPVLKHLALRRIGRQASSAA